MNKSLSTKLSIDKNNGFESMHEIIRGCIVHEHIRITTRLLDNRDSAPAEASSSYLCMVICCFVLLLSLPSQMNCSIPCDWANQPFDGSESKAG